MSMTAPVMNPHLMYRSTPISEASARRLLALGYAPERVRLLREGLPVTYEEGEGGELVLEYPSGRRVALGMTRVYDDAGAFVRYEYHVARELPPGVR